MVDTKFSPEAKDHSEHAIAPDIPWAHLACGYCGGQGIEKMSEPYWEWFEGKVGKDGAWFQTFTHKDCAKMKETKMIGWTYKMAYSPMPEVLPEGSDANG